MKKSILAVLLFLFSFSLYAANVNVEWTPPTERESCDVKAADGTCTKYTPLAPSEIGGYHIYYGTTKGAYNQQVDINDPSATNTVMDLPRGFIYYIVITAFDTDDRESVYSEFISVAVDHGDPKRPTGVTATVLD